MLARIKKHPMAAVAIVAVAVLLAALVWQLLQRSNGTTPMMMPAQVVVSTAGRALFIDSIEAIGTAKADESVTLAAKVTETVRRVNFNDGDAVKEGDILVELTSAEDSALLDEAKANLLEAEQQYERIKDLVSRGSMAQARLDEQTALRNAAKARVEALAARLKDRLIRAPFTGVLGFRQVSPGTLVQPNTPIVTIDDIDVIKLDFAVPEQFVAALAVGQDVEARAAAYEGRIFRGRLSSIDSRVDPTTRAVTARAIIDNPDHALRPGMLLVVSVIRERAERLAVLEGALIPVQDTQQVYVVEDGKAVLRQVKIGRRRPGVVEITEGLREGEQVVVEGMVRLFDGAPVAIQSTRPLIGPGL